METGDVESGIITSGDSQGESSQPENAADVQENLCPVCMEPYLNQEEEESSPLQTQEEQHQVKNLKQALQIDCCGHVCCRECLIDYCNYHISVRQVPVPCPILVPTPTTTTTSQHRFQPCPEHLSFERVQDLFATKDSSWIQYQRLHALSNDPTLVSCTRCDEIVPPPTLSGNESNNDRTCPSCQHAFCAIHGDAHVGRPCREHTAPTVGVLPDDTKACSHCTIPIHKFAGCDHVICPVCQKDMCFRCGTHTHLSGQSMTRYCSNCRQGYLDHRYLWRIRFMYLTWFILALPVVLVWVAIALVITLLSGCCCGCFNCGRNTTKTEDNPERHVARGTLYVGLIILLPMVILLYDSGYQWSWLTDFMDWLDNGTTNTESSSLSLQPTASSSVSSQPTASSSVSMESPV